MAQGVFVPGGRPSRNDRDSYPELAELAAWFRQAIVDASYPSVNAFVQQHTLDKNKIYDLVKGTVLLSLDSTERLARLLKRDPAEIRPIWLRAREARDLQLMAEDENSRPQITSWAEIPRPELALRNVLDGLTSITEQLPYRLLGVTPPPLSTVYVRQRLRGQSNTVDSEPLKDRDRSDSRQDPSDQENAEALVTLADALNRSEHLLITGDPGAGKSTLGHQLISRLARIWLRQESAINPPLDEPVIPLRVSARSLADGGSWSSVLAQATAEVLRLHLVTEPSQQLFAGRTHGARWLIVVDGLDEILDQPTRLSVIRALGQHARVGSAYRFVITTRPLPDDELAPLRGMHIGTCKIQLFEQEELRLFAERWFLSQDPITADQRAQDFLNQVSDSRLTDLVRNPLLASIAAVAYTREPERPLPVNRIDLYQRFYEYLVTDVEASGRDTPEEIRRFQHGQPERYRLAAWMHSQRTHIIDEMAKERLSTDKSITETACSWVRENKPETLELSLGWDSDLDRLLNDTGMFVYESSGLRFLHHTFAEFLAARAYASEIPADFPDREAWFNRGLKEAERNFVLLTLASWGRSSGNDIGLLLRSLLERGRDGSLLAGRLLAEFGDTGTESTRLVVGRLIDLALGSAIDGGELHSFSAGHRPRRAISIMAAAQQVLDVIGLLRGNKYAADLLRALVKNSDYPFLLRLLALEGFSNVESQTEALDLLEQISKEGCTRLERLAAAGLSSSFRDGDLSRDALELLIEVKDDPQATSEFLMAAARGFLAGGRKEEAFEACWTVISRRHTHRIDTRAAAEMILTESAAIETDLQRLTEELSGHDSSDRAEVAREMHDAGYFDLAKIMSRGVLSDDECGSSTLSVALETLLNGVTEAEIEDILNRISKRKDWKGERPHVLETLLEAGQAKFVADQALEILKEPSSGPYETEQAIDAYLAVKKPETADEVVEILRNRPSIDAWTRASSASALANAGYTASAVEMAQPVLLDPQADSIDLDNAARVIRQADSVVLDQVMTTLKEAETGKANERARTVQVMSLLGEGSRIVESALQLLGDRTSDEATFQNSLEAIISTRGASAAGQVVETLVASNACDAFRFAAADRLAHAGALGAAATLWSTVITSPTLSTMDSFTTLTRMIWTGHRNLAIETLRGALENPSISEVKKPRLASLLAWAVSSDPRSNGHSV